MTIEEMEKEIERLKSEIKKEKDKITIPDDIIKTPEYGWVKLLPCGVGEDVFVYEFEYDVEPIGRRIRGGHLRQISAHGYPARISEAVSKIYWKIKTVSMKTSYYTYLGKRVFKTKEEAETKIKDYVCNVCGYTEKGFNECFKKVDDDSNVVKKIKGGDSE